MQIGDVIHLDGLKAEYNFFGRDRFSACTLPDGDYVIVALEDNHIKLAWTDAERLPVAKASLPGRQSCLHLSCVTELIDRNSATTTHPGGSQSLAIIGVRSIFFAFGEFLNVPRISNRLT